MRFLLNPTIPVPPIPEPLISPQRGFQFTNPISLYLSLPRLTLTPEVDWFVMEMWEGSQRIRLEHGNSQHYFLSVETPGQPSKSAYYFWETHVHVDPPVTTIQKIVTEGGRTRYQCIARTPEEKKAREIRDNLQILCINDSPRVKHYQVDR